MVALKNFLAAKIVTMGLDGYETAFYNVICDFTTCVGGGKMKSN